MSAASLIATVQQYFSFLEHRKHVQHVELLERNVPLYGLLLLKLYALPALYRQGNVACISLCENDIAIRYYRPDLTTLCNEFNPPESSRTRKHRRRIATARYPVWPVICSFNGDLGEQKAQPAPRGVGRYVCQRTQGKDRFTGRQEDMQSSPGQFIAHHHTVRYPIPNLNA